MVVSIVNAVITSGMMNKITNPAHMHRQENTRPRTGIDDLESALCAGSERR
ncbi:hypothetical protein D3C77_728510 [compost metagenome]